MLNKTFLKKKKEKGVVLYLTVVVMFFLLTLCLGINLITLKQLKMFSEIENSLIAFYAADSGVEKALYEYFSSTTPACTSSAVTITESFGNATFSASIYCGETLSNCTDSSNEFYCIKSIGEYRGVKRAIETGD